MMVHGAQRAKVLGCGCERCRDDVKRRNRLDRESRKRRLLEDPTLAEHGKATTYTNWGCRCERCTADHSRACREYKEKLRAA